MITPIILLNTINTPRTRTLLRQLPNLCQASRFLHSLVVLLAA